MGSKLDEIVEGLVELTAKKFEKWKPFKTKESREKFKERQRVVERERLERRLKRKADEYIALVEGTK